jgi:hypothetical protein
MMDNSLRPPEALMCAIKQELRPVKSSPRPLRLVLRMVPVALLVSSLVLFLMGLRGDLYLVGPLLGWGASLIQFGLAIAFVWIAGHESQSVDRLPRLVIYSAIVGASVVVALINLATFLRSPAGSALVRIPPAINELLRTSPWIMGFGCGIGSTVAGGILVLLFSWLFRNSLATRSTEAGALYGGGAGLAINSGWRIACPVSTLWHSLGAHGAAIIATVILGALIGRFLGRRRLYFRGRI